LTKLLPKFGGLVFLEHGVVLLYAELPVTAVVYVVWQTGRISINNSQHSSNDVNEIIRLLHCLLWCVNGCFLSYDITVTHTAADVNLVVKELLRNVMMIYVNEPIFTCRHITLLYYLWHGGYIFFIFV